MSRRDSLAAASPSPTRRLRLEALEQRILLAVTTGSVSYTHLTLPTIYSV